jgi:ribosomal-protein-alanine N-acetyltransferase
MKHDIELQTQRLVLKNITPTFIHKLFETQTQEEIISYFKTDKNGYHHLKEMREKGMETHRMSMFYFLLFDKKTQNCIGECGFHTWNKTHGRAELFYNLKDDVHKQKGLMTEVLAFGVQELNLHRIEALTASWNTASLKLLEKFKFSKEGTMREDYLVGDKYESSECYALLKHEWKG